MLGANRFLSCGADSTITPIFAGGLALMATSGSPDYQLLAVALALEVGVLLVAGSLFRMGWIANLLSTPVMVGFLARLSGSIFCLYVHGVDSMRFQRVTNHLDAKGSTPCATRLRSSGTC